MPSLSMYLAIAKKYIEKHPEENEEEFIKGILEPDRKHLIKKERAETHYGEKTSHRPNLNKYYQENGLDTSYNRGYFLNLLTDDLFYNRFLKEFSIDIAHDFRKLNKKIEEKYDVHVPQELEFRMRYEDGEVQVIDEESVFKFIETVADLDIEQYKTRTNIDEKETKIKMIGLKEGLLYKHNYSNVVNSHDEVYFYGFENNYGVLVQRIIGGAETEGAREGLYRFAPVGIATKPSKMMEFDFGSISIVKERFSPEERDQIREECEKIIGRPIVADVGFGFQNVSRDEVKKLLEGIRKFDERIPKKEVKDNDLNSDLIRNEDIEIE